MYPNFMVICITIGVVSVLGGCVKDRFFIHESFPGKEAYLKDVELIDGDLKLKLDHKIEEKELLEKTLAALKGYFLHEHEALGKEEVHSAEKIHVPVMDSHKEGKHEITFKILESMLGSDIKVEELSEKDLAAFEFILKCLFERIKSKEGIDKISKSKMEESSVIHSVGHGYAAEKSAKMLEVPAEESEDVKTYLAESILHAGINKDATVHHGLEGGDSLLKKLEKAGGEIPIFLKDDEAKEYFKSIAEGKIGEEEILHSLAGTDEEAFKKLSKILKSGVSHEESSFIYSSEHGKDIDLEKSSEAAKALEEHKAFQKEAEILHSLAGTDEEAFKKLSKILKGGVSHGESSFIYSSEHGKDMDLEKSSEAAKALEEHKAFQKEAVLNHGKDHVFDEILKKEEMHSLDKGLEEDKYLGAGKVFEEHGTIHKEKATNHAKDHIYDDILKKEEVHSLDKGLEEDKYLGSGKAFEEHGAIHKEKTMNHAKDHIYDDILKKEEVYSLGKGFEEDKLHESAKGYEDHLIEKGIHASGEKTFGTGEAVEESKYKEFIAKLKESGAKTVIKDEAGKDISIEDILKEDGYYITGGTHAYEAARDQAHVDATVPLVEDKEKAVDSSIAHGEGVFHTTIEAGAEFAKGKEVVSHGIKGKEGILKEKAHGIDIGLEEGHINHGIKTEEPHLIHGIPEEHHVATGHKIDGTLVKETHHSKAHQIKEKLLSILRKIIPIKKCHLVTMPPPELLGIVNCISRSKDPLLCEKFAMCEKKKPLQVILALEKCQKETIPGGAKRCSKYEPLYPSPDIPVKIFKCVVKNTHELTPPEKKMMMDFEECARQVKIESCGRVPWG